MTHPLTIGQLARRAGMPAKTIRYYEQVGVLPPPSRTAAGYRQYSEDCVRRVQVLSRARALGVSLQRLKGLSEVLLMVVAGLCYREIRGASAPSP
jgi:MerR family copper efflux transcriptional regulator